MARRIVPGAWSKAGAVRGQGVQKRPGFSVGELPDGQREHWCRPTEAFAPRRERTLPLAIFPADRPLPEPAAGCGVPGHLERRELRRPRRWGAGWLACQRHEPLGLDRFRAGRLPDRWEGPCGRDRLPTLVGDRLIDPGSEWQLPQRGLEPRALGDWLGRDYARVEKNALYRPLDQLRAPQPARLSHLQERGRDWFGAKFDGLLYGLTSTCFERGPPPTPAQTRRGPWPLSCRLAAVGSASGQR